MDLGLQDKVVLVTGAAGGIGSAIACAFVAEGARVALTDVNGEALGALVDLLALSPDRVWSMVANAADETDVAAFVDGAHQHFGRIDVVVPVAGVEGKYQPIQDVTMAEIERVYSVNVFGTMFMLKHAVPYLLEQKSGSIVVMASANAYNSTPMMSVYASSKAAVASLTKCVAGEVGRSGIHVNYVCPGPVETPMIHRIEEDAFGDEGLPYEKIFKRFSHKALDRRYCRPEEVADAVLFLASERTSHTQGMPFQLDCEVFA